MCWGGVAGYGRVEELAMVPMCCGRVAGYGTHVYVLGWSSWLW